MSNFAHSINVDPRQKEIKFEREGHAPLIIKFGTYQRAIFGGVRRGANGSPNQDMRDDILAIVSVKLMSTLAKDPRSIPSVQSLRSFLFKAAMYATVDWIRRGRSGTRGRTLDSVTAGEVTKDNDPKVTNGEARAIALSEAHRKTRVLRRALLEISSRDQGVLRAMLEREAPLPRTTSLERRISNSTAQAEKRARDRLTKAVREIGGSREL